MPHEVNNVLSMLSSLSIWTIWQTLDKIGIKRLLLCTEEDQNALHLSVFWHSFKKEPIVSFSLATDPCWTPGLQNPVIFPQIPRFSRKDSGFCAYSCMIQGKFQPGFLEYQGIWESYWNVATLLDTEQHSKLPLQFRAPLSSLKSTKPVKTACMFSFIASRQGEWTAWTAIQGIKPGAKNGIVLHLCIASQLWAVSANVIGLLLSLRFSAH